MNLLFLFLTLLSFAEARTNPRAGSQDHYKSFAELTSANVRGRDYQIEIAKRPSPYLVMSFHGGEIEPGSTELARELAQDRYSFYSFIGIKNNERDAVSFTSSDLHLTSTRFDDPELLGMARDAQFSIALHGFGGTEADFCVGGASVTQRKNLVKILSEKFPSLRSCELCCPPYNGTSLKNPVNASREAGVQIEIGPSVRKRILSDSEFKTSLAEALELLFIGPKS